MFIGLNTKNKLFDPKVTNEINAAFRSLAYNAEDFKTEDLQPLHETSAITVSGISNFGVYKDWEYVKNDMGFYEIKDLDDDVVGIAHITSNKSFSAGDEKWISFRFSVENNVFINNAAVIADLSVVASFTTYGYVLCTDYEWPSGRCAIRNNKVYIVGRFDKDKEYIVHIHWVG